MRNNNLAETSKECGAREVLNSLIHASSEAKARDLTILDVTELLGLTDFFLIASARSDRQVLGIANRVIDALEKLGIHDYSVEGLEEGKWVLIDCGDVVFHIFYEGLRGYYDLEGLWAMAPRVDLPNDSEPQAVKG